MNPEEKAWRRYEGPRGGKGWQNPATGEVRYQEDEPDDDEDGGEPASDEEALGRLLEEVMNAVEATEEDGPDEPQETERAEPDWRSMAERLPALPDPPEADDPKSGPQIDNDDFVGAFKDDPYGEWGYNKPKYTEPVAERLRSGVLLGLRLDIRKPRSEADYGPFKPDTTIPFYDMEDGEYPHTDVTMNTEGFLNLQSRITETYRGNSRDMFFGSAEPDKVQEYADLLENAPGELPMPHIVVDETGEVTHEQEGRHRGLAALAAGIDRVPVRVVVDPGKDAVNPDEGDAGAETAKAGELAPVTEGSVVRLVDGTVARVNATNGAEFEGTRRGEPLKEPLSVVVAVLQRGR